MEVIVDGLKPSLPPFSQQGAPVKILAKVVGNFLLLFSASNIVNCYLCSKGRVLDTWGMQHNAAAPPPQSPVKSTDPLETITLIPFGATDLRIAEFPVLDEE